MHFRSALIIFFLLAIADLIAQDSTAHRSRWSIGLNVAPALAYRDLKLVDGSVFPASLVDARNDLEDPRFGGSIAIMAAYSFNERFAIEAGIGYTLHGWQLDLDELSFGDPIDPRRGFVYATEDLVINSIRQEFHYLDVPIRGTITFGNGRWRSVTGIGGSLNFLMRAANVSVINDERRATELDYYEDLNFTVTGSTGIAFVPKGRSEFRLEPTFRYALLPIIDAPITGYLWSAGVNFGWYRRF